MLIVILADLKILERNSQSIKAVITSIKQTKALVKFVDLIDNAKSNNSYDNPKEDFRFVCLQIVIDNLQGDEDCDCNPNFFKVKDTEGNQYSYSWTHAITPSLTSDDVEAGDISKGWLTFELPESQPLENFRIRYDDSFNKSSWISFSEIKVSLES